MNSLKIESADGRRIRLDDVAALTAQVGAEIIRPKFGRLEDGEVRRKSSPSDLVTAVDEAAERALRDGLAAIAPEAGFIGEEAAAGDPSIVARMEGPGLWWVVDPLDGTGNFVRGKPEFGTIVALVEDGRALAGWINAIPDDAMMCGAQGVGVYLNGADITPTEQAAARPRGLRTIGWLTEEWRARLAPGLKANVETTPGMCSAYGYVKLARGETDFKLSSRIHPWDHVAGVLMLEELGGATRYLDDGAPFTPADSADRPMLAAAPGRDIDLIGAALLPA